MSAYYYGLCRHCQHTISRYPTSSEWYDYVGGDIAFHCPESPDGAHSPVREQFRTSDSEHENGGSGAVPETEQAGQAEDWHQKRYREVLSSSHFESITSDPHAFARRLAAARAEPDFAHPNTRTYVFGKTIGRLVDQ